MIPNTIHRKSKILFYSQHSVGIGHYVRIMQILKALEDECRVFLINGGQPICDLAESSQVQVLNIPPLDIDPKTQKIYPSNSEADIGSVRDQRKILIRDFFNKTQPDVFVTEFFPFGRWYLRDELLPILTESRIGQRNKTKFVCSLRDIPQDNYTRAYSIRCCSILNTLFHNLLIHSDPRIFKLDDQFPFFKNIKIPVDYTGYVTQKNDWSSTDKDEPLMEEADENTLRVIVSAGSGADQYDNYSFFSKCISSKRHLDKKMKSIFYVFTGPFFGQNNYDKIKKICEGEDILVRRFTPQLLSWLKWGDLSISRGGYNTCMNILESGIRSVIVPSRLAGDQCSRARKFEEMNICIECDEERITPEYLTEKILFSLEQKKSETDIDKNGAATSAKILKQLISESNEHFCESH